MESIYRRGGRIIFAFRRKASSITLRSQACRFSSEKSASGGRLKRNTPAGEVRRDTASGHRDQSRPAHQRRNTPSINAVIQINQLSDLLLSGSPQTRTKLLDGILYLGKRSPGRHGHVNSILLCTESETPCPGIDPDKQRT